MACLIDDMMRSLHPLGTQILFRGRENAEASETMYMFHLTGEGGNIPKILP